MQGLVRRYRLVGFPELGLLDEFSRLKSGVLNLKDHQRSDQSEGARDGSEPPSCNPAREGGGPWFGIEKSVHSSH
jgi:hypothetical protein